MSQGPNERDGVSFLRKLPFMRGFPGGPQWGLFLWDQNTEHAVGASRRRLHMLLGEGLKRMTRRVEIWRTVTMTGSSSEIVSGVLCLPNVFIIAPSLFIWP